MFKKAVLLTAIVWAQVALAQVVLPPTLTKTFTPSTIGVNNVTTVTLTLTNPNQATNLLNLEYTDTLPLATYQFQSFIAGNTCDVASFVNATGVLTVDQGSLAAGASCVVTFNVVGLVPGVFTNTTSTVAAFFPVDGPPVSIPGLAASAVLTVQLPPTISKTFADSQLQLFGPSTALTFTINNPNTTTMTGIAFSDILPAGLLIDTPNGLTGSCGGGTITAVDGSNSISLSGAALAAGASCTFSVNVSGIAIGQQVNETSAITAATGIIGNRAYAKVSVTDLFFLWFFSESGGGRP